MDLTIVVAGKCEEKTLNVIAMVVVILNLIVIDTRSHGYSSDRSRKTLNRDRKINNHHHGTTPGSNSENVVKVLVS